MEPGLYGPPPVAVGRNFKMVLRWVGGLTLVLLGVSLIVALVRTYDPPKDPEELNRLFDVCIGLVEAGFGAIIGLLGGKNL